MPFNLQRDARWNSMGINASDDFEPIIKRIRFVSGVSKDVESRFERVKSAIRFSFYDYDLLDVALDYSLFTLELAIKKRYQDLEQADPADIGLAGLIKWGCNKNLFEPSEESMLSLKELRNNAAHPRRYSLWGYIAYDPIIFIVDVINGMYEDPLLRRKRKGEIERVNTILEGILREGALLREGSSVRRIFKASLLHFENRIEPSTYYFAVWQTFELIPDHDGAIDEGEPLLIKTSEFHMLGNGALSLITNDPSQKEVIIEESHDESDTRFMRDWMRNLGENHHPEVSYIEFTLAQLRSQLQRAVYDL